jgi:hypothetical protein
VKRGARKIMAVCPMCSREMTTQVSCLEDPVDIRDVLYDPVRYGDESLSVRWAPPPFCGDCATPLGGVHHPGCDMEACPICFEQAISCGHFADSDDDGYADESPQRGGPDAKAAARHCRLHRFRQVGLS